MYLIHVHLALPEGALLPADTRQAIAAHVDEGDGVEHVSVHPHAVPCPVVGLYLLAESLEEAEARALEVCRRAVGRSPHWVGWEVVGAGAPLVAPYYDRLLSSSGLDWPTVDATVHDRFSPEGSSSPAADQ
ncbi:MULTISPECIES: hypothetical protein [unclassified Streptomyces]|uniref:hypothetical protein n=1 Tax=unclassified Streptomyces TaxID=2593676 RepID=UPI003667E92A